MSINALFKAFLSGVTTEEMGTTFDLKLSREGWELIEESISPEQQFLFNLIKSGAGVGDTSLDTIPDEQYAVLRETVRRVRGDLKLNPPAPMSVEPADKKTKRGRKDKKKKKMSKKAIIIANNKERKMTARFSEIMEIFTQRPQFIYKNIVNEPVEFIIIRLLLGCPLDHIEKLPKWIIMAERTITNVERVNVSATAISDAKSVIAHAKIQAGFSYEKLNDQNPANFLNNYSLVNTAGVDLYPFQKEFIEFTSVNKNGQYVMILKAIMGGGKTLIASHLAFLTNDIVTTQFAQWRSNKIMSAPVHTAQLYFVCPVEGVRTEFAKYCYSQQCPYSITTWDFTKGCPRITPANLCKKTFGPRGKEEKIIIEPVRICDPLSALRELQNKSVDEMKDITVFLDEYTIGADEKDSFLSRTLVNIMSLAPRTIWSTATPPEIHEIKEIVDDWKTLYPDGKIHTISAMKSQIGCQCISTEGVLRYSHRECKNAGDIKRLIDEFKTNPFLCRMSTVKSVFDLRKTMLEFVPDAFDIESALQNGLVCSHTSLVSCHIKLLTQLSKEPDNIIKSVCSKVTNIALDVDIITPQYLATTTSDVFKNQTLLATLNPIAVAQSMLKSIADAKGVNLADADKQMRKIASIYESRLSMRSKQVDRINKRYKEKELVDKEMESVIDAKAMDIGILRKFRDPRGVSIFDILADTTPNWVKMCLMSGIGIYCTGSDKKFFSKPYRTLVAKMLDIGALKCAVSDKGITYGTDWAFGNVMLTDDLAENMSVLSVFQLFGRAGRVGKCFIANAFASKSALDRVFDYTINNRPSVEGANMIRALQYFKQLKQSMA
jgi:hypothetical protein